MVSRLRPLGAAIALALLLGQVSTATASGDGNICDPAPIRQLVVEIAPDYTVALPTIQDRTLVIEVGAEGKDWRGVLTLNVADETVYTSVGGDKLTPELRPKLQALVEKAASTPAIRDVLKRCARTSVQKAEEASTQALQRQLDAQKTEAPPPTADQENASTYITKVLPALWALLLLTSCLALWRRRRRTVVWRSVGLLTASGLLGFILRVWIPPWGPGDISNTVSGVQSGAEHLMDFGHYGRGIEGLLILVSPLMGSGEDTLVGINLAVAVLTIPLIYALTRRLGYGTTISQLTALLLALAPLHMRFSPTYNRYIVFVFLMLLGWTMLLAFLARRDPVDLVLSFCALALGMQCRPEAAVLPLAALGLLVAHAMSTDGRRNLASLKWPIAAAFVVLIAAVALPVSSVLETAGAHQRWVTEYVDKGRPIFDPAYNAFLSPWLSPIPWALCALWGLMRPPQGNRWIVAWLVAMALGFTAIVSTRDLGTSHVIDARYHLSALPFYLILTAAGAHGLMHWLQVRFPSKEQLVTLGVSLGLATSASLAIPSASLRTTMNQEYDFIREHLPSVPNGCAIVAYEPDFDLGLRAPFHLSANLGLTHDWMLQRTLSPSDISEKACVIMYRPASCTTITDVVHDQEGQDGMCGAEQFERLEVLAQTDIDAIPAGAYVYKTDPIRIGFYWLKRP